MRKPFLAFFTLCALFVMAVSGQDKATGAPANEVKDLKSLLGGSIEEIEFPTVDGWTRGEKQIIPDDGGGRGHVINYDSKTNGRVTVYIYTRGLKSIPDGLGKLVEEELEGAKAAIRVVAGTGAYGEVKGGKTETITLGGDKGRVKSLRASYVFNRNGQVLNSEIYLFGYQDHFIKLRASRPASASNEAFAALLLSLDQLFSKTKSPNA